MKSRTLTHRNDIYNVQDFGNQTSRTLDRGNNSLGGSRDKKWSSLPRPLNSTLSNFVDDNDLTSLQLRLQRLPPVQRNELTKAFSRACSQGCDEAVKIFLQNGVDVNIRDQYGYTGLYHAVIGNHPGVVEILINGGANLSDWWTEKESILHWASRRGHVSAVVCLIDHGASVTVPDANGRFPLHSACLFGVSQVIPVLLSRSTSQPGCSSQRTTLYSLSNNEYGPDVLDENQWTPLHYACSCHTGNPWQVVHELMKANANPMIQTPNGKSSLDLAFESGRDFLFLGNIKAEGFLALLTKMDSIRPTQSTENRCSFPLGSVTTSCEEEEDPEVCQVTRRNMSRVKSYYSFLHDDFSKLSKQKTECEHPEGKSDLNDPQLKIRNLGVTAIWQHILKNDDVDLLKLLCDFRIHENERGEHSSSYNNFAEAYDMEPKDLSAIHMNCFENGLAIFSFIRGRYREELEDMKYKEIFVKLTRLQGNLLSADVVEGSPIMTPLSTSVIFIALLSGRFRVLEMLLRMRQFDILPAVLIVILIIHKLAKESAFTNQAKKTLLDFAKVLEILAVDMLNKISLKDNSKGKFITITFLSKPLGCLGRHTIIDIAAAASCESFLSLPSCQSVIYNLWHGKLNWLPCSWKIMSIIFPLLLPLYLINRQANERKTSNIHGLYHGSHLLSNNNSLNKCATLCKKHYTNSEAARNSSCADKLKMITFVFTAPVNKFIFHSISHIIFLILFSYVLLYDFHFNVSRTEMVCHMFIYGYMIEEARQIWMSWFRNEMTAYVHDIRNIIDLSAIILSITGCGIRYTFHHRTANRYDVSAELMNRQFYNSRLIFLTALFIFYMRIMFVFSLFSRLGPRIRMMFGMIRNDLLPMLCIFSLFFISFGVIFQGILFPNGFDLTEKDESHAYKRQSPSVILSNIVMKSFYGMLSTEYNMDKLDADDFGKCNTTDCKTIIMISKTTLLYGFYILYVLIVNVMLLNLLIALYSYTITDINEKSTAHWFADKYSLAHEFRQRSICPSPLNAVSIIGELIWSCCRKMHHSCRKMHHENKAVSCSCKTMRYLMLQAFALRDQRHKLGQTQVQEATEISDRIAAIEKQVKSMTSLMVRKSGHL